MKGNIGYNKKCLLYLSFLFPFPNDTSGVDERRRKRSDRKKIIEINRPIVGESHRNRQVNITNFFKINEK